MQPAPAFPTDASTKRKPRRFSTHEAAVTVARQFELARGREYSYVPVKSDGGYVIAIIENGKHLIGHVYGEVT